MSNDSEDIGSKICTMTDQLHRIKSEIGRIGQTVGQINALDAMDGNWTLIGNAQRIACALERIAASMEGKKPARKVRR